MMSSRAPPSNSPAAWLSLPRELEHEILDIAGSNSVYSRISRAKALADTCRAMRVRYAPFVHSVLQLELVPWGTVLEDDEQIEQTLLHNVFPGSAAESVATYVRTLQVSLRLQDLSTMLGCLLRHMRAVEALGITVYDDNGTSSSLQPFRELYSAFCFATPVLQKLTLDLHSSAPGGRAIEVVPLLELLSWQGRLRTLALRMHNATTFIPPTPYPRHIIEHLTRLECDLGLALWISPCIHWLQIVTLALRGQETLLLDGQTKQQLGSARWQELMREPCEWLCLLDALPDHLAQVRTLYLHDVTISHSTLVRYAARLPHVDVLDFDALQLQFIDYTGELRWGAAPRVHATYPIHANGPPYFVPHTSSADAATYHADLCAEQIHLGDTVAALAAAGVWAGLRRSNLGEWCPSQCSREVESYRLGTALHMQKRFTALQIVGFNAPLRKRRACFHVQFDPITIRRFWFTSHDEAPRSRGIAPDCYQLIDPFDVMEYF